MSNFRKTLLLIFSFVLVLPLLILIGEAVTEGYENSALKKIIE